MNERPLSPDHRAQMIMASEQLDAARRAIEAPSLARFTDNHLMLAAELLERSQG